MFAKFRRTALALFIISLCIICVYAFSTITIVNITSLKNRPTLKGIVYKTELVKGSGGGGTSLYVRFHVTDSLGNKYEGRNSLSDGFGIDKGDTLVFRRTNYKNRVRSLSRNGIKLQPYYGWVDLLILVIILFIILRFTYLPKVINKWKKKHNERLFKDYYN